MAKENTNGDGMKFLRKAGEGLKGLFRRRATVESIPLKPIGKMSEQELLLEYKHLIMLTQQKTINRAGKKRLKEIQKAINKIAESAVSPERVDLSDLFDRNKKGDK